MIEPRSDVSDEGARYGLGLWLAASGPGVYIEGCDAGASFRSWHDPSRQVTYTVLSNTSEGAWPIVRVLRDLID